MADRYWVGGTANWDVNIGTLTAPKWAATSGGGGDQSVPTSTDAVFFDSKPAPTWPASTAYTAATTAIVSPTTGNNFYYECTTSGTTGTTEPTWPTTVGNTVTDGTVVWTCRSPTITIVSGNTGAQSIDCTGFTRTIAGSGAITVSGSVTLVTGMTWSYTGTLTINATGTLTSAGKTFAGITKLIGSTTLTLADNLTMTGALGLTAGTLDINSKTLTAGTFSSVNSNNRTLAFGASGVLNLTSTGTVFTTSTGGNLFVTSGSKTVNVTSTANNLSTISVLTGAILQANAVDFNFQAGSYNITLGGTNRNVNFTGYSGALNNQTRDWVGNVTFSTGMTLTAGSNVNNFSSTGTQTITTNGRTLDFPLNHNGSGGTLRLLDTLTQGTTRSFTHTNGTLDLNGQTLIVGTYATAAGTKNITFNAGILRVAGGGTTAFNNAVNTGFSTTAGTGSGEIQMTNSGTKTFAGNNATYSCTLAHNNTGALTLSGNNTFTSISNTSGARTFTFTSGTTTTVTNWLATGNAGNVVTVNSTTAGTQHFLSKSGGGTVSVDYMSIQDSNASPSTSTWYAGTNSTNVSNNFGWIFTAPPAPGASTSNFLFLWAP